MRKGRLTGLDGLRGLAALSVVLSHIGFGIASILNIPIVILAYKTLAVGPNSVQIFFVLSGFLMAFLYSKITSVQTFLKKRYARIIPIYAVVVIFLGILRIMELQAWYQQFFVLISLAVFFYISWKIISRFDKKGIIGNLIFYSFIVLQISLLIFNFFITPKLVENHHFLISDLQKEIIFLLSNLTLTTQIVRDVGGYSTVFWTLAAELYFYLLYPFIAIPLINLGKRYGFMVGAIIVIATTKIIFDLDDVMRGLFAMSSINIARTCGFIVGVLIGTIYESKSTLWKKLEGIFSKFWINILILIAFILIQAGDWSVRDGQSIWFMNRYYLLSSWIFGLTIIAVIIPNTLIQKIFSHKILVFFGLISYSLYLTHINVSSWVHPITGFFSPFIPNQRLYYLFEFSAFIMINVLISYILYTLVEALYFQSKAKSVGKNNARNQNEKFSPVSKNFRLWTIAHVGGLIILIMWLYTGNYTPTLFVAHHNFQNTSISDYFVSKKFSLLETGPIRTTINAKYDNLSVVTMRLWYYKNAQVTRTKNKNPAILYFRLYEKNSSKPIFESSRSAFEIEGEPNFPFGLNTLTDSVNKKYSIELQLVGGSKEDDILVNLSPASIVTTYTNEKSEILKKPYKLVFNRLGFMLTRADALFLLGFIAVILIAQKRRKPNE
ncbi:hypothetical protein A3A93_03120 [Candidatus Roizmanbacteria bacterium RIFCSPLOWO2_01_FULL_38_12]|uniref:Acyltransferase 3 domain-containing protein n=1 Tax=Candidatus Roizmanbacteria bacterium RIFCSPLOWO2_01_FULL_38_12 TaxID=1802061 RepID=A0A1F7ISJ4_9BACT|nr:MAG: hypothetical protein A2861_03785 [Candidatus Roizmanbacteria bacterium RIFCSPHIGHO2_01_FULL_38_15]OGK35524.1 MAG: hypothetical protein A3F59_05770 [Candidatus Roizmanbacteria bacterium RIFCSPHIGHO2_12_FULL_38_13]OGK46341.1 MAG: hypothetical protein A3A93_03120 [Candidatus Roizmanbacteria bacterium RIFCSPLOWO2_01_FULL_38_12]